MRIWLAMSLVSLCLYRLAPIVIFGLVLLMFLRPSWFGLPRAQDGGASQRCASSRCRRLRFVVGQRVECRIDANAATDWAEGTATQLWYRGANWPPGSFAPYRIQLDDGRMVYAPHDAEQTIRSGPPHTIVFTASCRFGTHVLRKRNDAAAAAAAAAAA